MAVGGVSFNALRKHKHALVVTKQKDMALKKRVLLLFQEKQELLRTIFSKKI